MRTLIDKMYTFIVIFIKAQIYSILLKLAMKLY